MITVISGTNRPASNSRKVAALLCEMLNEAGESTALLDLAELPLEVFESTSYASVPRSFAPFQSKMLETDGLLMVVPEYNGSFPGVVKYFIDMLSFPDSLNDKPAAFIGISAGRWGGVRAVEQLELVFHYRRAHLFGKRCFIPSIGQILDSSGRITDPEIHDRLRETTLDFALFCRQLCRDAE